MPPSPFGLKIQTEPGWAGCISARLDASIGAPGPHDFAVRARPRQRSCRASCTRRVLAKTVGSVVRPRAVRSLTGRPALRPPARPTLSRPSHPAPTSVTIAKRPSVWDGMAPVIKVIWAFGKPEYFCARGWTTNALICPAGTFPGSLQGTEAALPLSDVAFAVLAIFRFLHQPDQSQRLMMSVDGGRPEVAGRD